MPVKCTGIEVILELVVTKSLQVYWKKWRGALKLIIKLFLKESKSPLELAFKSSFRSTFEFPYSNLHSNPHLNTL